MNREQWLEQCAKRLVKLFKSKGYECSPDYRVSVGFPKSTGIGYSAIGQCWSKVVSTGKVSEIFISPVLDDAARVADVLAHELAHHVVGIKERHGKVFKDCVYAIGLEGKPTATTAGPAFVEWFEKQKLPAYPHARMTPLDASKLPKAGEPPKPDDWETTPRRASGRTVKHECGCGMKWTTSVAMAERVKHCPCCGKEL
jgi:hypothetical protein